MQNFIPATFPFAIAAAQNSAEAFVRNTAIQSPDLWLILRRDSAIVQMMVSCSFASATDRIANAGGYNSSVMSCRTMVRHDIANAGSDNPAVVLHIANTTDHIAIASFCSASARFFYCLRKGQQFNCSPAISSFLLSQSNFIARNG